MFGNLRHLEIESAARVMALTPGSAATSLTTIHVGSGAPIRDEVIDRFLGSEAFPHLTCLPKGLGGVSLESEAALLGEERIAWPGPGRHSSHPRIADLLEARFGHIDTPPFDWQVRFFDWSRDL